MDFINTFHVKSNQDKEIIIDILSNYTFEIETKSVNLMNLNTISHFSRDSDNIPESVSKINKEELSKISNHNSHNNINNINNLNTINIHNSRQNYHTERNINNNEILDTNTNILNSNAFQTPNNIPKVNSSSKYNTIATSTQVDTMEKYNTGNYTNSSKSLGSHEDHSGFTLKLKYFKKLKKYLQKRRERKFEEEHCNKEKELTAKVFYQNLIVSRSFYGFQKVIKNNKIFRMIHERVNDYNSFHNKKIFLKMLVSMYNRNKLVTMFHELRYVKIIKSFFNSLIKITNKQMEINHNNFVILAENQICSKFLLKVSDTVEKLETKRKIKLKKKQNLNENINILNSIVFTQLKRKIFDSMKIAVLRKYNIM